MIDSELVLQKYLFTTMLLAVALAFSMTYPNRAMSQDPTIKIKTATDSGTQSISATFTVENTGNKKLVSVTLYAFRVTGGKTIYTKLSLVGGMIPNIDLGVAGTASYTCVASLEFEDGVDKVFVASPLTASPVFVKGVADDTDYGTLSGNVNVSGKTITIVDNYAQDAGKKWIPKKREDIKTALVKTTGGRLVWVNSKAAGPTVWLIKRENVANGSYFLLTQLTIEQGGMDKLLSTKIEAITVAGECDTGEEENENDLSMDDLVDPAFAEISRRLPPLRQAFDRKQSSNPL